MRHLVVVELLLARHRLEAEREQEQRAEPEREAVVLQEAAPAGLSDA